jgi:hypothetical protein
MRLLAADFPMLGVFLGVMVTLSDAFFIRTLKSSGRSKRELPYGFMCNIDSIFQCICIQPPAAVDTSDVPYCWDMIENYADIIHNAVKLTITYKPPPHYSDLNLTTDLQIATAQVLNNFCIDDKESIAQKCGMKGVDLDGRTNLTRIVEPPNVVIIQVKEVGDDGVELKVSFAVMYHKEPFATSGSLISKENPSGKIGDFQVLRFSVLQEAMTESIMAGAISRALGVEVHTLEHYYVAFPYVEVIVGCIFGALFMLICILSACKASK